MARVLLIAHFVRQTKTRAQVQFYYLACPTELAPKSKQFTIDVSLVERTCKGDIVLKNAPRHNSGLAGCHRVHLVAHYRIYLLFDVLLEGRRQGIGQVDLRPKSLPTAQPKKKTEK